MAVGLVAVVVAVLLVATVLVNEQKARAVQAAESEAAQRKIAVANEVEANTQRDEAIKQKAEADRQRGIADANATEAERQKGIAQTNEAEANTQRDEAIRQKAEADRQRGIADTNAAEAIKARDEAVKAAEAEKVALKREADAREAQITAERGQIEADRARIDAERAQLEAEVLRKAADLARERMEKIAAIRRELASSERGRFDTDEARARQAADATADRPVRISIPLPDRKPLVFVYVPPGDFAMGSPIQEVGRAADEALRPVEITRGFWMAETSLTRGQWRSLVPLSDDASKQLDGGMLQHDLLSVGNGSSGWKWRTLPLPPEEEGWPATGLSLTDVRDFLSRLADKAPGGLAFRLPTEAEWEYAARAGTLTPYHTGSTEADARRAAWLLNPNAEGRLHPHPVGKHEANAWGLRDMHGNVYEMTSDYYYPDFAVSDDDIDAISDVQTFTFKDPRNDKPDGRPLVVVRGGSYLSLPSEARSARRETMHAGNRHDDVGVRLVLSAEP